MSRLRQVIARRLVESQQTTATLTTFNEVDMSAILEVRARYKESFQKKHGVPLGFMSFFVAACCEAMNDVPETNARVDGTDVVYPRSVHVGVAVGTDRGLVVPVVRHASTLPLAGIEAEIGRQRFGIDHPARIDEAHRPASNRPGKPESGMARQGLCQHRAERLPCLSQPRMVLRGEHHWLAQRTHFAACHFGNSKAGIGAANIGDRYPHGCCTRFCLPE